MNRLLTAVAVALALFGGFLAGALVRGRPAPASSSAAQRKILYWHDPMHPEYRSDKPGIAPDCGMQLEPVYADGAPAEGAAGESMPFGTVRISGEKQQLVGVRVSEVETTSGPRHLRTVGRVVPDERRVYRLNTSVPGWVRDTYGHTTGSLVKKGEPLIAFSTSDLAPQQNYLITVGNAKRYTESNTGEFGLAQIRTQLATSRAVLESLGMSDQQIEELERDRKVAQKIVLRSPVTGVVLARNVTPGLRFEANRELAVVADLRHVWVLADVFQYEAGEVKPGQEALVTLPQRPSTASARVSETLPQFDEGSRTLKLRLELDNPDLALQPGMFVDVDLPLSVPPALTVPVDAVLDSGLRKRVFVDRGEGFFEPREVETGWRSGERVQILRGLVAGERVVTSGAFLVDAESRLKAAAAGMRGPAAKDVVCGMDVDEDRARAAGRVSTYRGKRYVFCSDSCKHRFEADPEHFAERDHNSAPDARPVRTDPVPVRGVIDVVHGSTRVEASPHD
ncbi:MAG TPA: efflux RND transporter periplasmic adaptor subunit [Myxococcaceae bacterium]|nr:efflux RND transporter periplasmic adaptor subunit [Myxococcaceae bacterium]